MKKYFDELIKYEYKNLLIMFLICIISYTPVNYYITTGGGISDIKTRVQVNDGYKSKGSLNISYVSELDGTVLSYLLSYILPNWSRTDIGNYKYDENESLEDLEFRSDISLTKASNDAIKVAFEKAHKSILLKSSKYYIISKMYDLGDINLKVGDQVLAIDDKAISDFDYREYISNLSVGATPKVTIIRDNKQLDVACQVYESDNRKVLGLYIERVDEYTTDPEVQIKFKSQESGPSGGLITTLSIYNQLVEEDITKGLTIAGTGTIDQDGNVGEIGGVEYKLMGAVSGGADVFLVPAGTNYKEVMKVMKKKKYNIKVLSVSTFDEAIEKLNKLK